MMLRKFSTYTLILVLAAVSGWAAAADRLELSSMFTDHMVMQRQAAVPVWGWADPGAQVTCRIAGQSKTAVTDGAGTWRVKLDPLPAGDAPLDMTVSTGDATQTVTDILVGEVWICSGQSNMGWPVKWADDAEGEIAAADYPKMRLFTVKRATSYDGPLDRCEGQWEVCTPATVGDFSAVAYYFGRQLHKELPNVPIGLIHSSWGATTAEAWTSRPALEANAVMKDVPEQWDRKVRGWDVDAAVARDAELLAQWNIAVAKANEMGTTAPRKPRPRPSPLKSQHHSSTLYNGMIAPVVPYGIRGAIWYQGESNAGRAEQYHVLFPLMIRDWRTRWGQGDFPFYFVQLANFTMPKRWEPSNWAYLREAQTATLSLPNTGMAVTLDIGDSKNIHPKNKQDVGARLALWALVKDYGREIAYSGPLYKSMAAEGGKIRIRFGHAKGLAAKAGAELGGFVIAGADKVFVPAKARVDGQAVVVWSDAVAAPVAARYGWRSDPVGCNLVNAAGLPASGFRTDDWPREE